MSDNRHTPNVFAPFEAPYATKEQRAEHAAGLRALADWVETTRFPIPALCLMRPDYYDATIDVPSLWIDDESFVQRPGSAARLIGGRVDKGVVPYGTDFTLTRDFGGGVRVRYRIDRGTVCEKREVVVSEERSVPEDETTASSLAFQIGELQKEIDELPRVTRKVPATKTEYVCPESLLAKTVETVVVDQEVPF